jgi:hypothetical protein
LIRALFRLLWKIAGLVFLLWILSLAFESGRDFVKTVRDEISLVSATAEMKNFHTVLMAFYTRENRYPEPDYELWRWFDEYYEGGPYRYNKDPWDNPYYFLGSDWEILCEGPDEIAGSRDDLIRPYPRDVKR